MNKLKALFLVALSFFLFLAGYRLLAAGPAHAQVGAFIDGASIQYVPDAANRRRSQSAPRFQPSGLTVHLM